MSGTVREQLLARAGDGRPGLLFEDRSWTWDEVVRESVVRCAVLDGLLPEARPPHVGVLLENTPEFCFLLGAAALGGHVVVGLNPTRRGSALAADIARSDTQVVLTDSTYGNLLGGTDVPVVRLDSPAWTALLETHAGAPVPDVDIAPNTLMMLIFTSGTSGDPKAVNVTQAKVAGPGVLLSERFGLGPGDVAYLSMPMFHSNAIMAGWGPALASGATIALAHRFSASGFLPHVRRYGATYANYVGKPLAYILATPERDDDADNPLRLVFGNEANERDIAEFGRRFGCTVVDSYSSTENAVIVQRVPEMPPGSLGRPLDGVKVIDPEAEAERMRVGMYWSGDLAYRDADGFVYFAGRTSDWLRVDGENLAAAPIERILLRHPAVSEAAVYAVPDERVGDQVMAALVTTAPLSPGRFETFLADQSDLSPKAWPRYVRLAERLPRTATNKVLKRELAAQGPVAGDGELWVREPRGRAYASRG